MIEAWPWQPNRPNPNDEMASDRIEWRQIKARKRLNHQLHRLQSAKIEAHEATFFFSFLFFPGISERDLWISAPTVEINWFESVGTGSISPAICDKQSTLDTNVIFVGSSWFNVAVESTEWQPINLPICCLYSLCGDLKQCSLCFIVGLMLANCNSKFKQTAPFGVGFRSDAATGAQLVPLIATCSIQCWNINLLSVWISFRRFGNQCTSILKQK